MSRRFWLWTAIAVVLLSGCGGGNKSGAAGSARATFTIRWPERGKLVPAAANSVKVSLSYGATWHQEQTADRPVGGGFSTVSFDTVPVGSIAATASAYPQTGARGVAQATGGVTITTHDGQTSTVPLTMDSTVTAVTVTPSATWVGKGRSRVLTAEAKDSGGATVLVAPDKWDWQSGSGSVASVTGTGTDNTASLVGVAVGQTAVTARYTEPTTPLSATLDMKVYGGPQEGSPWPMEGHDALHTGRGIGRGASGVAKWRFATLTAVTGQPVIAADGTIYAGGNNDDCKLYAINPDGTARWAYTTGGFIGYAAAIGSDGTVYAGSGDSKLYALNPDGTLKWAFTTGSYIESSPAVGSDGTIYIGSYDCKLYAVNPDGTQAWAFATGAGVQSSPAIGTDGTIYVGSNDHKLYALAADGTLKWTVTTGDRVACSPAVGPDGTIYVGSDDHHLYALNVDGTQKWAADVGGRAEGAPAIAGDGTVYLGSEDHSVYAFGTDGTQLWTFAVGGWSAPVLDADGVIYTGSMPSSMPPGGRLYAINPNGTQRWSFYVSDFMDAALLAVGADGTIYFGCSPNGVGAVGS